MLVVTRLNPACHVAYVDVSANAGANANELARNAADEHARDFDCNNQPIVIGKSRPRHPTRDAVDLLTRSGYTADRSEIQIESRRRHEVSWTTN